MQATITLFGLFMALAAIGLNYQLSRIADALEKSNAQKGKQ